MEGKRVLPGAVGAFVALLLLAAPAGAVTFTEFSTPAPNSGPLGITNGPDGALWFTEQESGAIGRIDTAGAITEFPIPRAGARPREIARGPDGNLYYTDELAGVIGRVTTAGAITETTLPNPSGTQGITSGPDGALWFTQRAGNQIGRITTAGAVTEFPLPNSSSLPLEITSGPDGALWFTEESDRIGRITTAGAISEFPLPTAGSSPRDITTGPDGALWFTELLGNRIGRITTAGAITEFPVPTDAAQPSGIATGGDGALWFTENNNNAIGRIDTAGAVTEAPLPEPSGGPNDISGGPDGSLWFTRSTNRVDRLSLQTTPVAGQTVGVAPVAGTVLIKQPGATDFRPLSADVALPTGTEVDTIGGRVRLTAETGSGSGATKTAEFYEGRFKIRQPASANAVVEAALSGPLVSCRGRAAAAARKGRRLWGDGKGSFSTKGKKGSATVRGTRWLVEDRCDGSTRFVVKEGSVTVRDFVRRKTIVLRAGRSYIAGKRRR